MVRRREAVRFRRPPHLVTFWRDGDLQVHNYATGACAVINPLVCTVLDQFDHWCTVGSVTAGLSRGEAATFAKVVRGLANGSFLERSDRAMPKAARAVDAWRDWNPAAGFFHFSTKDVAYERSAARAERRLRAYARHHPMPRPTKSYPRATQVPLPAGHHDDAFARVLLERRTWRHFSARPVDLQAFATLLQLTFGVQRWATARGQGPVAFKTSPSGGARHAIEAYVLALRVRGLPRGLYHYAADRHALERLTETATRRQLVRYCGDQSWCGPAAAIVIMTAVFERERWRYPTPRAYRALLLDAGHLGQTFCLAATWLGLAPFSTMALADSRIERDLGIDGARETVMYVAGVGSRPEGGWNMGLQRAALRRS